MGPDGMGPAGPAKPSSCVRCGGQLEAGANFCHKCGQAVTPYSFTPVHPQYPPYQPVKDTTIRDLGMGIGTYATIALLVLMAVNVLIAIWGIGQVYPHMDRHIYLFIITPYIVNFAELGGWPFFIYYALNTPHYPYQGDAKWLKRCEALPYPRNLYAAFVAAQDERIGASNPQNRLQLRQLIQNRLALPWCALGFALLGVSLGQRRVRASAGVGFGLSLIIVFVYYLLFNTLTLVGARGALTPALTAWAPNVALFAASIMLLVWRKD